MRRVDPVFCLCDVWRVRGAQWVNCLDTDRSSFAGLWTAVGVRGYCCRCARRHKSLRRSRQHLARHFVGRATISNGGEWAGDPQRRSLSVPMLLSAIIFVAVLLDSTRQRVIERVSRRLIRPV